jgi:putative membrane protein
MPLKLKEFLARWAINTLAVLVASRVVSDGIRFERPIDLLVASLILGMLTAFVRPVLMILSLPILIVTLGLFTLVINAVLLFVVGWLMRPKFVVDSFGDAFWGALVISGVSLILGALTGTSKMRLNVRRKDSNSIDRKPPPPGGGPIIDV